MHVLRTSRCLCREIARHSALHWILRQQHAELTPGRCQRFHVRHPGDELGTRCEIKNVNSIRFLKQAIEYEARRQIGIVKDGVRSIQTQLFDPNAVRPGRCARKRMHTIIGISGSGPAAAGFKARVYRGTEASLPELPDERKQRFISGVQALRV